MSTEKTKTEKFKQLLDNTPYYIIQAYQKKHKVDLYDLLKQYIKAERKESMWNSVLTVWIGFVFVGLVVWKIYFHPASVSSNMFWPSILIVGLISIGIGYYSQHKCEPYVEAKKQIKSTFNSFESVLDNLSPLAPGFKYRGHSHEAFAPIHIRERLVILAENVLSSRVKVLERRPDLRYSSQALEQAIQNETVGQNIFDRMWEVIEELSLPDPTTGNPYVRGVIFDLARKHMTMSDS